ncbi:leucyl aminopeptidase family protein [Sphingomonas flavalba]|uniref:leucyl aminopeptidase family protein n=1 Tax=Sphingomonas flavalba TaxID=2559804 RepID=UPI0039E08B8A
MTEFAALLQPDKGEAARAVHIVDAAGHDAWLKAQPPRARAAAAAQGFAAKPGDRAILPADEADGWSVAVGVAKADTLTPWCLADAAGGLPEGRYRLVDTAPGAGALGWLLAQHRFTRYRAADATEGPRVLLTPDAAHIAETVRIAESVALVRDMVNTAPEDMGPAAIEAAVRALAEMVGGHVGVVSGADLERDYPMVHAVGRAAGKGREPRLVSLEWGNPAHPRVAIVGKGVCFDSGGLDIKSAAGMRLMKKDMGGAAHALALARLVTTGHLPVRLHLLIPAVENAVAGNAFRPGDVLKSRKGPSVEVSNTDAEGRLILGDALARAFEEQPALTIDFATLTGAARVALGPDLPALFANDDALAADLLAAGAAVGDPVWRLPLWDGYDEMLKSDIADIDNAPEGGMAGAVTAALFLRKFVPEGAAWAHFDTFAWRPSARPGRPKGGEALGLRAAWAMLRARYGAAA